MDWFTPTPISLARHATINEAWLQDCIAENPSMLGLGDLDVRDRERRQSSGGRLDMLLQDPATLRRYEVELQLGATDEQHIIRTIEYWDVERKRYPQYEHCAVIVAEDITSRFLNVISLFNGVLPLIAIKLSAYEIDGRTAITFTKVLDEMPLGLVDEDEPIQQTTDRAYWIAKGAQSTMNMVDELLERIQSFAPGHQLKYNKHYVGLTFGGAARNFVTLVPQKKRLVLRANLPLDEVLTQRLEDEGLVVQAYDRQFDQYNVSLAPEDLDLHRDMLDELMRTAHEARG